MKKFHELPAEQRKTYTQGMKHAMEVFKRRHAFINKVTDYPNQAAINEEYAMLFAILEQHITISRSPNMPDDKSPFYYDGKGVLQLRDTEVIL